MIRTFGMASLAVALLASTAARASDEQPKDDKDQKICKALKVTGTRLGKTRVCYTKAVWDEMERQAREESAKIQNNTQNRFSGN